MNPSKMQYLVKSFTYSKLTIATTLILTAFCLIEFSHCDLQQISDVKEEQQNSEPPATGAEHGQQTADPEYIKRELRDIIAYKIDADKDGQVSYEELKKYLADLHEQTIDYNVDKQWSVYSPQIHEVFSWEGYEPERKEVLTWDHYFNQTYPELMGLDIGIPINREQDASRLLTSTDAPSADATTETAATISDDDDNDPHIKMLKLMVRRADARWKLADDNGDTLLTKNEFKMLLHPDEGLEELQNLFVHEATEDMDLNNDGKICLQEFMKHVKLLATDLERDDKSWLSGQQENFGRFLDKDKDGVLDASEIRDWLIPPKSKKFDSEARRLFAVGDTNEDHHLSKSEILENYEQYLGLLPPEYWQSAEKSDQPEGSIATMWSDESSQQHEEL